MDNKDIELNKRDLSVLEELAGKVITYSEDDRRKADNLYNYFQNLIEERGSAKEIVESLAKALELREKSVNNFIEILKLKTRLIEKKMMYASKNIESGEIDVKGRDTNTLIAQVEELG